MPVRYNALDPERSEVRLLTILPGNSRDPIRCSLSLVSLNEAPEFEALSYMWGNSAIRKLILVDADELLITTNLEAALRQLRRRKTSRILWVDAICIDQQNIIEKNAQIPLMRRIYSDATSTIVWLGESENRKIEDLLAFAGNQPKSLSSADKFSLKKLLLRRRNLSSILTPKRNMLFSLRILNGFMLLLDLPYWGRMWTYQEYSLPSEEPICYYGNIKFIMKDVLSLSNTFGGHLMDQANLALNYTVNSDRGKHDF